MRLDTVMVSSLFLCIFWICSPYTGVGYYVWYVRSDGNLVGRGRVYEDSYGRTIPPDTSYDYILDNRNFVIEWGGNIDGLNDPDDSYGLSGHDNFRIYTNSISKWYFE